MMPPFDTALLKHQPDHLRPLTRPEKDAARHAAPSRMWFGQFIAQVFAGAPRSGGVDAHGTSVARPASVYETVRV